MGTMNRSTQFQAVFILLAGALCTPTLGVETAVQAQGTGKIWHVKYLDGPISTPQGKKHRVRPLPWGASLKVNVGPAGIVFQKKNENLLSVPFAGIDQITYDRESHRVSRKMVSGLRGVGPCGDDYGCGAIAMVTLAMAAVALPFKSTNHYITIAWREKGEARTMKLKFNGHDYLPFLSELQRAMNKPWRNLAEEKAAFRKAQKNSRKLKPPIGE